MLQINLSTRPFYNERAIHLVLLIVALVAVGVMVAGVLQLVSLAEEHAALTAVAERDEQAASAMASQVVTIRRRSSDAELESLAAASDEANWLIDQRIFSWTEFFNRIEQTVPAGVMLTSVRPEIARDSISVAIGVIGRRVSDIGRFIDQLEATGAFTEVLARAEEMTEEGTYRTLLVGRYLPVPSGSRGSGALATAAASTGEGADR